MKQIHKHLQERFSIIPTEISKSYSKGNVTFFEVSSKLRIFLQECNGIAYVGFECKRFFKWSHLTSNNDRALRVLFGALKTILNKFDARTVAIYPHSNNLIREYANMLFGVSKGVIDSRQLLNSNGLLILTDAETSKLVIQCNYGDLIKLNKKYNKFREVSLLCPY